ncbi:MAG: toxin-antitoxin system HicB family antitoxin [Acidimicrobiales bacterium]
MLISDYWSKLRSGLEALGEIGGPETSATAQRLSSALEPIARTALLDAVNELVQEFNLRHHQAVGVTLGPDDVQIAPLAEAAGEAPASPAGDLTARFALRISDELKSRFEQAAAESGQSANTWILRALDRSLRGLDESGSWKREMRGRGHS